MDPRPQRVCLQYGRRRLSIPMLVAVLALIAGCEEERNVVAKPKAQAVSPAKDGFIVGKRTQEIKKAAPEVQKRGATVASTNITARDPVTLPGNAYVTMIGRTSVLNIEHAVDLFHATNDRYPKDYGEFMSEIIKANNIALPVLPNYQKYSYDEKEHKLVILEYPDLKNQPLSQ